MLLYFAADLIWASKIKGVANALGIPARPVRSIEMLDARLADSPVKALLVDLDVPETALQLIAHLNAHSAITPAPRILAWGPHVEKDLLQNARNAGAHEVLTRGSFDHSLADILLRLNA